MNKVLVMGGGSWGTTLAVLLAEKGNDVTLWEFNKDLAKKMKETRENAVYLKGITLPDNLKIENSLDNLLKDVDYLVLSIPSQFLRGVLKNVSNQIEEKTIIINTAKGIEISSHTRLSEVIKDEILGKLHKNIVVLSGPTHAEEVANKIPSAIVAASANEEIGKKVQDLFTNDAFRVYYNSDIIGVEVGGALKNCIAIATGIADGLGFGDNSRSAIITRGLAEMVRFGEYYGADFKTFSGLSGVGDLITTCTSRHSRNRFVGEKLGQGKTIEEILSEMVMVAEGVPTVKAVYELSKTTGISMPIIDGLYEIIYENENPEKIVSALMTRELKSEF